jgi:hypothetical protein
MGYMAARTESVTTPTKLSGPANEALPWRRSHSVTRKTSTTAETFIQRAERELLAVHREERTATPW